MSQQPSDDKHGEGIEDDGYCPTCDGSGTLLDCCDDVCQGQGFCMHGDGERVCPTCGGDG